MANGTNGRRFAWIGAAGLFLALAGLVWAGGSRMQSIEDRAHANEKRMERIEDRIIRDIGDIKHELREINRRLEQLRLQR